MSVDCYVLYMIYVMLTDPPTSVSIEMSPSNSIPDDTEATITCTAHGGNPQPDLAIGRDGVGLMYSENTWSFQVQKEFNGFSFYCRASGGGIQEGKLVDSETLTLNVTCKYAQIYIH